jgi:L-iditol 2-dehydrogenase
VTGRLSADQAALCEPLSIGVYAVQQSRLAPGADAAVLGAGPIGLSVLLAARAAGAGQVFMTDRIAHRVAFARQAGATWSGHPDQEDVVRKILEQQPAGMDVVYECAGKQATLDQAVELLKPGGRLMIVGIPQEDRVSFLIDWLRRKEITLINVRRQNRCVPPAIDLVASGTVGVDALITHRFPLDQTQAAFELVAGYRDGVIKAVIEF